MHACIHGYTRTNRKYESQVILLQITSDKKWHYLYIKKCFELLRGITSKHEGNVETLNFFRSYIQKISLKRIIMYVKS